MMLSSEGTESIIVSKYIGVVGESVVICLVGFVGGVCGSVCIYIDVSFGRGLGLLSCISIACVSVVLSFGRGSVCISVDVFVCMLICCGSSNDSILVLFSV